MHKNSISIKKTQAYIYALEIVQGKVKAGRYVKLSCQRFLDDLERQENDPEFEWYFDLKTYNFIMTFQNFFKFADGIKAGQPMKLSKFQHFILGNIFCWKHKEHKYVRFSKAYIQIARKNGKSMILGYIGLIKSLLYEYAQVYCVATKREQSAITINEIRKMLQKSIPQISKRFSVYGKAQINKIICELTKSELAPLSSDARTLDGLGMDLAIVDEFGGHKDYSLYEVCRSSQLYKLDAQIISITTAYPTVTSPAYSERCSLMDMLDGKIPMDERYFSCIYELDLDESKCENGIIDDIEDKENWVKANPLFAEFPEIMKKFESDFISSKTDPQKLQLFKNKNLNIWTAEDVQASYLDFNTWKTCEVDEVDFSGLEVFVGIDLSKTTDLCGCTIVGRDYSGKLLIKSKAFLPKEVINYKEITDKLPYSAYVHSKPEWICATEGKYVNQVEVEKYVRSIEETYHCKVKGVSFDSWNALYLMSSLESDFEVYDIKMTYRNFSPVVKKFREEVYDGNVEYEKNSILDFCVANAVTKSDTQENILLDKKRSVNRIDLLVSAIIGFAEIVEQDTSEQGGDYFMV